MFEGMTCLYKSNVDLFFYVVGSGIIANPKQTREKLYDFGSETLYRYQYKVTFQ
jgi:hypothetical protein